MEFPPIPPDFGEMVGRIMSDPDASAQIMNIMSAIRPDSSQQSVPKDNAGQNNGDFSQVLGKLMGDPQIMGLVRSLSGTGNGDIPKSSDSRDRRAEEEKHLPDDPKRSANRKNDRDRIALLNALKPYLGESRRQKIEGMIKLLELMEFAKSTHLLDRLLPGIIN